MKSFREKTVVITGAGAGMGRAYALEFARLGAHLALNDADAQALDETLGLLQQQGLPAAHVYAEAFDVSRRDAVYGFAEQARQRLGPAHVLINNAGVSGKGIFLTEQDDAEFERLMQVNFFGVLHGCQAFLPQLMAQESAALVNVSSVFGLIGMPGNTDYCASKFAVRGLTEALMVELHDTPVQVHLVHPGGIRTNIAKHVPLGELLTQKYLKTEPQDIVRHVIRCLQKDKPRIVYGHSAFKTWLISWCLPLRLRTRVLFNETRDLVALSPKAADWPQAGQGEVHSEPGKNAPQFRPGRG
ncbi:SDR family NAD(P)-dependent oxidoreductase [Comamonas composti]|uniref:SDR family NAD(P)-dependent oxidoreductase n=1 Tax=Comamonas composti TaxID=408558 RepID=UPI0004081416|nr:SDR family oxidoreductase [Comamonas composti]